MDYVFAWNEDEDKILQSIYCAIKGTESLKFHLPRGTSWEKQI